MWYVKFDWLEGLIALWLHKMILALRSVCRDRRRNEVEAVTIQLGGTPQPHGQSPKSCSGILPPWRAAHPPGLDTP
jgi:hypothetical protein